MHQRAFLPEYWPSPVAPSHGSDSPAYAVFPSTRCDGIAKTAPRPSTAGGPCSRPAACNLAGTKYGGLFGDAPADPTKLDHNRQRLKGGNCNQGSCKREFGRPRFKRIVAPRSHIDEWSENEALLSNALRDDILVHRSTVGVDTDTAPMTYHQQPRNDLLGLRWSSRPTQGHMASHPPAGQQGAPNKAQVPSTRERNAATGLEMLAKELACVPDREQVPEPSTELTQDMPQRPVPMVPSESGVSSTNAMITRTIRAAIADIRQS